MNNDKTRIGLAEFFEAYANRQTHEIVLMKDEAEMIAAALRAHSPEANALVSSKDRLPDHNELVIVKGGVGYWDGIKKAWFTVTGEAWPGREICWEVTHWMPMPSIQPQRIRSDDA